MIVFISIVDITEFKSKRWNIGDHIIYSKTEKINIQKVKTIVCHCVEIFTPHIWMCNLVF